MKKLFFFCWDVLWNYFMGNNKIKNRTKFKEIRMNEYILD